MPSGCVAEEMAASLGLNALPGEDLCNRMQIDMLNSERKKVTELTNSKESHFSNMNKDGRSNLQKLQLNSMEQIGRLSVKAELKSLQTPASRTVGFQINALASAVNGYSSTIFNATSNKSEVTCSQVSKRLLSPLSGMLLADNFKGDNLDISSGLYQSCTKGDADSYKVPVFQEYKKVHTGNWSESCFLGNRNSSSKDEKPCSDMKLDSSEETNKISSQTAALSIPQNNVSFSPSFPLSPLGPKFSGREKLREECSHIVVMLNDDSVTLKDMESSLDRTFVGFLSTQKEEDFRLPSKLPQESNNLHKAFNLFTFDDTRGVEECCTLGTSFPPQSTKLVRTLSGLPVRRSLVGSFEESLLSGRLLSGKVSQVGIILIYEPLLPTNIYNDEVGIF